MRETDGQIFRSCFQVHAEPDLLEMGFARQSHMHYVYKGDDFLLGFWIQNKSDHTCCCVNVYADYLFYIDVWGKLCTRDSIVKSRSGWLSGRVLFHRAWFDPHSLTDWWKYRARRLSMDRRASIESNCRRFSKAVMKQIVTDLSAVKDLAGWIRPITDKQILQKGIQIRHSSLWLSGKESGRAYFLAQAHRHLGDRLRALEMIQLCSELHESDTTLKDWEKKPLRKRIAEFEDRG